MHGQPLCVDGQDVDALRAALRTTAAQHRVAVWSYAFLPQALALVVRPDTADGLGRFMQGLSRHYVPPFNRRHGRLGALWASRFRAAVVEPGERVLAAMAWVERQAMTAGVPGSWTHHLGQARDPLVAEVDEFWALGNTPFEREDAWRQRLTGDPVPDVEAAIDRALRGAWPLGGAAFTSRLEAESGQPVVPRSAGRPRLRR